MDYSKVSNMDNGLVEIRYIDVKKGQSVVYKGDWYKATEDAHTENGFVGFMAEDEEFKEVVIETSKNNMAYAEPLHTDPGFVPSDPE